VPNGRAVDSPENGRNPGDDWKRGQPRRQKQGSESKIP
jgi:hypothetical protein